MRRVGSGEVDGLVVDGEPEAARCLSGVRVLRIWRVVPVVDDRPEMLACGDVDRGGLSDARARRHDHFLVATGDLEFEGDPIVLTLDVEEVVDDDLAGDDDRYSDWIVSEALVADVKSQCSRRSGS